MPYYQRRSYAPQPAYRYNPYYRPSYGPRYSRPAPPPTYTRPYRRRVKGNGAYTVDNGPWANAGAKLGKFAGRFFGGNKAAGRVGEWIGRRMFHYPAKLFGSGSYDMVQGGPATETLAPQVPMFEKGEDDSVLICHREYLGDIITSGTANAFNIQDFGLNPSDSNTFPWLSALAQSNFQQYKFEGLIFEFKSFSADALNSTNTALGSVFAAINYDYNDSSLASRYEVENTDWSMSCKPSDNMLIPVECKPRQTGMNGLLYVLNGPSGSVPTGTDAKTYFLGKLFIGTTGFQGTSVNCGSLYVTYKIRLYKPIMTRPLSNCLTYHQIRTSASTSNYFGTADGTDTNGCDCFGITLTATTLTIPKSRILVGQVFLFIYDCYGSSTASLSYPAVTVSDNVDNPNIFRGNASSTLPYPRGAAVTDTAVGFSMCFSINNNNEDAVFTLSGGTLPTSASCLLMITQINGIPFPKIGDVPSA